MSIGSGSAGGTGGSGEGRGILPDAVRRALVSGLSAVFMTEEGIRSAFSDMRLPKEAMGYLLSQSERSRRELFRIVTREVKGFLRGVDVHREIRTVLTGLKVRVRADVSFVPAEPEAGAAGTPAAPAGSAAPGDRAVVSPISVQIGRRRRRKPPPNA